MSRKKAWLHFFFWGAIYLIWVVVFQKQSFAFTRTVTIQFCYLFFVAANFYFIIYFLAPRFLYRGKILRFGLFSIAGIVSAALLRVPIATYLNKEFFIPNQTQPGFRELFLNSLLNISIWVISLVAAWFVYEKARFKKMISEIEKEKNTTELNFLKAQFNPHFLFNSINSIYGHIDKQNAIARTMLLKFSEMLRYQLYECNVDRISIEKEINYIRNYVSLQQMRKDEDLFVKLDIDPGVKGFTIVPLLFIAFIENAFKYVSDNDSSENKVEISLCYKEEQLTFRVFNTKEVYRNTSTDHKGIGIVNVKRRLELLYPSQHELIINDSEKFYEIILRLQIQ